jgi:hypothetical protein
MGIKMEDGAAQTTLALLKLAKEIADAVVGDGDQATVRAVFDRLCMEVDARTEGETLATTPVALH